MTNVTLESHQTRVARAEEVFGDDLQRLARWSRRRVGKGKVLFLLGAAALVGVLTVRSLYVRRRRIVLPDRTARAPSLIGTALRMAVLEAARLAASRLVLHLSGGLDRPEVPRLARPALPNSSGIDPKSD